MKTKFETFNDGTVDVYIVNDDDKLKSVLKNLRFGNENVGVTRHYAARSADIRIDRMIHVIRQQGIEPHQVVVIEGRQYDIEKVDEKRDTLPPVTRLSLICLEKHKEKEFA